MRDGWKRLYSLMILPSGWHVCSAKPVLGAESGAANESVDRKEPGASRQGRSSTGSALLHSLDQDER